MNCKDCKYWRRNSGDFNGEVFMGSCSSDKLVHDPHKPEKDQLTYADYEEYSAFLETGEDFGCIHFKCIS